MNDILMWILSSWLALAIAGAGGTGALLVGTLGLVPKPWGFVCRWGGKLLLFAFFFLAGWRGADDSARQKAALERLENDNARLAFQLAGQKKVAEIASRARDELQAEKATLDRKVADYETLIRSHPPEAGTDACLIDDADLRFRRGLRKDRR